MSEFYKEAGYSTHLVGKWHLGFYQEQYTPTKRGFDTHFGYLGPWVDYFDHTFKMFDRNYSRGLDLRKNLNIDRSRDGNYATDLFTEVAIEIIQNHDKEKDNPLFLLVTHLAPHAGNDDFPLQAKQEDINQFSHIENPERKKYAGKLEKFE
jgi:arylsulfatase B